MLAAALAAVALLPGLLTPTVAEVKTQTPLPILLPDAYPTDVEPIYGYGGGSEKEYSIGLAFAPDCGGANACFAAGFSARKGGHVRPRQGDPGARPPWPLPAALVRRVVLAAVDLVEGARGDLLDPGQGRGEGHRPAVARADGQSGDQAGAALSGCAAMSRWSPAFG